MLKCSLTTIARAAKATGLTVPTGTSAMHELQRLGIAREITARQRNRQFLYGEYYRVLERGATV